MKKIIISLLLLLSFFAAEVYADPIPEEFIYNSVKVNAGSGSVSVNEEDIDAVVYVSVSGTTMIEMSVITDAIKAEIKEDGDRITVTYQGVDLVYFINSSDMQVSGQTISMPETLVRDENGNIIVPLRFFAESLGADVLYDTETTDVTAEFYAMDSEVNFYRLLKYSDKTSVGNSKQGWRFKKPDTFEIYENYIDDGYNIYLDDAEIVFTVYKNSDGFNLEQVYAMSESLDDYRYYYDDVYGVVFERTKGERAGLPYVCYKTRHTESISEIHLFLSGQYIYLFSVSRDFENFSQDKYNAGVDSILNSFETGYAGGDEDNTIDLAIDSGKNEELKTEYTDGNLRWSVKLLDNWKVDEYYGFYNRVNIIRESDLNSGEYGIEEFRDAIDRWNRYSFMSYNDEYYVNDAVIEILTESIPAEGIDSVISQKREMIKNMYNRKYINISDVKDTYVGEKSAKMFSSETDLQGGYVEKSEYYYINGGAYFYEIVFSYDKKDEECEGFLENAREVINSFTPGEFNPDDIGDMLSEKSYIENDKVTKVYDGELFELTAPCLWSVSESGKTVMISNSNSSYYSGISLSLARVASGNCMMGIAAEPLSYYDDDLSKSVYTLEEYLKKTVKSLLEFSAASNVECDISEVEKTEMFGKEALRIIVKLSDDDRAYFVECTSAAYDEENALIMVKMYSDLYQDSYISDMFDKIEKSVKLK